MGGTGNSNDTQLYTQIYLLYQGDHPSRVARARTAFEAQFMRPANWDHVTHNQCLLKKKSWSLYILEPHAAKRTLLDSSARYCCHTHPSVELLTRSLSTFSLLSWQRTHVYTRHTGKELLDARFPIRKMEKETESEAPPSSIKKRRCGYKKDWDNEYLWLKGVEGDTERAFFFPAPAFTNMQVHHPSSPFSFREPLELWVKTFFLTVPVVLSNYNSC